MPRGTHRTRGGCRAPLTRQDRTGTIRRRGQSPPASETRHPPAGRSMSTTSRCSRSGKPEPSGVSTALAPASCLSRSSSRESTAPAALARDAPPQHAARDRPRPHSPFPWATGLVARPGHPVSPRGPPQPPPRRTRPAPNGRPRPSPPPGANSAILTHMLDVNTDTSIVATVSQDLPCLSLQPSRVSPLHHRKS